MADRLIGRCITPRVRTAGAWPGGEPEVVHLAVGFSVSHEAGAHFVEHEPAVGALETRRVPLEVGCDSQDELVEDRTSAARTRARPTHSCSSNHRNVISSQILLLTYT